MGVCRELVGGCIGFFDFGGLICKGFLGVVVCLLSLV